MTLPHFFKVLTLASNERVPLTSSMRLLFEISHLRTATPATVSRAGILYVNQQDLGWNLYVTLCSHIFIYMGVIKNFFFLFNLITTLTDKVLSTLTLIFAPVTV